MVCLHLTYILPRSTLFLGNQPLSRNQVVTVHDSDGATLVKVPESAAGDVFIVDWIRGSEKMRLGRGRTGWVAEHYDQTTTSLPSFRYYLRFNSPIPITSPARMMFKFLLGANTYMGNTSLTKVQTVSI